MKLSLKEVKLETKKSKKREDEALSRSEAKKSKLEDRRKPESVSWGRKWLSLPCLPFPIPAYNGAAIPKTIPTYGMKLRSDNSIC